MKKTLCTLVFAICAVAVFAQDLYTSNEDEYQEETVSGGKKKIVDYIGDFEISGEVKTGVVWSRYEDQIDELVERTEPGSKDDAGVGPGRFRINVGYFNRNINVGFKFRINWENWTSNLEPSPSWNYAFGYAEFLDKQLTLSLGRLGDSPWGTGGPEMWVELESGMNIAGIRLEIEPKAVPGLNVGFVLNGFDGMREPWGRKPIPLYEYLAESVIGASYTYKTYKEWFHVRTALRLDSQVDGKDRDNDGIDGVDLIYRVDEYALDKFAPGLKFWVMGYIYSIGASENNKIYFKTVNWLFGEYVHNLFTTQIRFGLDATSNMNTMYIKPSFYFTPWDNLIMVGASFEYTKFFFLAESNYKDSPYHIIEVKPLLQFNINPNAYAAFEYSFKREYQNYYGTPYESLGLEPIIQTQYINIRVGVKF